MGFALVIVGLLMIVTGAKGTYAEFAKAVANDFTGPQPFTYWVAAIGILGGLGYIEPLRKISRMLLALILISMVLANRGVFNQLVAALKAGPQAPEAGAGIPGAEGVSSSNASPGVGGAGGTSFKDSLNKPGGGGFWDYFGIPKSMRPSWAQ